MNRCEEDESDSYAPGVDKFVVGSFDQAGCKMTGDGV